MTPTSPDSTVPFAPLLAEIRALYGPGPIPLHRPVFEGPERRWLVECIDSNFVSAVGARVTEFEERVAAFTGARHAVATVNGTAALHVALHLAGVTADSEVLTQALTFVATCNAVRYAQAWPVFIDVDRDTLSLSPASLAAFLDRHAERRADGVYNRTSGRRLAACVPMHTCGLPGRIAEIVALCDHWGLPVVEDAAESLGSWVAVAPSPRAGEGGGRGGKPVEQGASNPPGPGWRHTGTFGRLGILSFNDDMLITTGGGGMILTDDPELAARARDMMIMGMGTQPGEVVLDEMGENDGFLMPNLNAAIGCAQMERLPAMLAIKADIAARYAALPSIHLIPPLPGTRPNHWLNAVLLDTPAARDALLTFTNAQGVMTRPIWRLMHRLPMYQHCQHDGLANSLWLEERVVNVPSSVPEGVMGDYPAS